MKLRCIIIDDEFLARQLLEGYAGKVPYLEIVGLCESAMDATLILQEQKIDLIFLDVNMPGLSGINFIKALKHKPEIIITTAYSEHALEGYQLDVIEYLLKPIYFERFLQAVTKARDLINLKMKAQRADVPVLLNTEEKSLFVKTGAQKIIRLKLADIFYIESLHEYIRIHTEDKSFTIHHSLKNVLDILPSDQFIQIHRSFIINFNLITLIEGNTVTINKSELSVGKNFREDFMNKVKLNCIGINQPKISNLKSNS